MPFLSFVFRCNAYYRRFRCLCAWILVCVDRGPMTWYDQQKQNANADMSFHPHRNDGWHSAQRNYNTYHHPHHPSRSGGHNQEHDGGQLEPQGRDNRAEGPPWVCEVCGVSNRTTSKSCKHCGIRRELITNGRLDVRQAAQLLKGDSAQSQHQQPMVQKQQHPQQQHRAQSQGGGVRSVSNVPPHPSMGGGLPPPPPPPQTQTHFQGPSQMQASVGGSGSCQSQSQPLPQSDKEMWLQQIASLETAMASLPTCNDVSSPIAAIRASRIS